MSHELSPPFYANFHSYYPYPVKYWTSSLVINGLHGNVISFINVTNVKLNPLDRHTSYGSKYHGSLRKFGASRFF